MEEVGRSLPEGEIRESLKCRVPILNIFKKKY